MGADRLAAAAATARSSALGEYARHGRIYGTADRMREEAVDLWLTDYRAGRSSLLLTGSNEDAAALARMVRERLAERGRVGGRREVTLSDGNQAGVGDLVRARLNTKIDAGGQGLANRDMIRITGFQRRRTGPVRGRGSGQAARGRQLVGAVRGARGLPRAERRTRLCR